MQPVVGTPAQGATLLLLRHGQSEWNAAGRWQGAADLPLTALGKTQALTAAEAIARGAIGASFERFWSSDLGRAIETAEIIAEVLGGGTLHRDARLREADAGPWEGLRRADIDRAWPGFLDDERRPEGFEPADAVVARAVAACTDILASADTTGTTGTTGTTLVVTHSGVIRAVRRHLGAPDRRIPNLGGCWIGWDGTGLSLGEMVALVDDDGPSMAPASGRGDDGRSSPAR